jgi:P-type Ca2+ transporter type 2C
MNPRTNEHEHMPYWAISEQNLFDILQTSKEGLSHKEQEDRIREHGKNTFEEKRKTTVFDIIISQTLNPLIVILLFAGGVTWYLQEIIETVVILLSCGINIAFGTYQESKAENTIEKLKSYIKNKAKVLREGNIIEIDASDLVVGDIVHISYGSRVPADIRILEATNILVDEAILTGESIPVKKEVGVCTGDMITERNNTVFCGTYVVNGNATGVVVRIGNNTEIGKIATSVSSTKKVLTPVQNAVKQISWYIFLLATIIVIFIFILGVRRGESVGSMLVLSSAVAVGAVPEALPITLTVILAIGVMNISKKGGLIRKLAAAETLGSTTLILTDKTGTLTKAELVLTNIFLTQDLESEHTIHSSLQEKTSFTPEQKELLQLAYNNIDATVEKVTTEKENWIYSGGPFDIVILKNIYQHNISIEDQKNNIVSSFNSTNKYSISENKHEYIILGAPDILLSETHIGEDKKDYILDTCKKLSEQGKRLVAIARKTKHQNTSPDITENEFLGIFTFSDPLREHIHTQIADIQSKGVQVKIITGDLAGTAKYIAHNVGIDATDEEILHGEQIKKLTDTELIRLLPHIKIFVRVTPEDKLRIGKLYQSLGEIVAMTGDGVNDSPALKAMDIGISLASGSDVAKSTADMILLDNNFKTITDTITEGHKIRANIQKVFVYLMSNSLDAVFVVTGALITGLALPLNALQIIWVNIITGTLPALAFAYDSNQSTKKNKKGRGIFEFKVKFMALGIGALGSLLLFALYYILVQHIEDITLARSIFFACFSTYILTISYSFRNLDKLIISYNPFSNHRLNTANIIAFTLIFATIYTPYMQYVFNVTSIPLHLIWIVLAWNISSVWVVEFTKWVFMKIR